MPTWWSFDANQSTGSWDIEWPPFWNVLSISQRPINILRLFFHSWSTFLWVHWGSMLDLPKLAKIHIGLYGGRMASMVVGSDNMGQKCFTCKKWPLYDIRFLSSVRFVQKTSNEHSPFVLFEDFVHGVKVFLAKLNPQVDVFRLLDSKSKKL